MSCDRTVALGVYLLGSLDPAERSAFERHLRTCAACRREMLRLAPLPGLLSQVRLEDLELPFEDPAPDPDLYPLPEPEPAGEPAAARRRWPLFAGVGVLVAVLVAVGVLVFRPAGGDPVTWAAVDGGTGVAARADLVAKSWGTELWLSIRHVPPGRRCKLVVHDRAGKAEIGGWWSSDHAEDERIPGSTSFRLDQIERLDLVVDMDVLVSVRP
ncbi:zf-HC2 domain-containing protein [Actinosynnema sp. NPDC047251]|uniref:Putative membrane protein n=1 Tax=Saccharothrix espanaensis (strain ATCC 51144 / DSM 44229 / JCM 9112 / NBRC 15066 / NRRL 15764) TaxID=1179773 RepID=K0K7L7_SACES|nr:zf-HC2 domain-containing protein [Saccharothrix espanaensis]CCH34376.1 putative membrane protein [Saccharothrix espanaensis DSM 44229]